MRRTGLLLVALLALAPATSVASTRWGAIDIAARSSQRWGAIEAIEIAAAAAGIDIGSLDAALADSTSRLESLPVALTPARDTLDAVLDAVEAASRAHALAWAGVAPGAHSAALADPSRAPTLLAGLDRGLLLAAQRHLVATIDAHRAKLASIRLDEPTCIGGNVVCIGTDGDDVWTDDVQVLIEPGGDDLYLNNAGGALQATVVAATGGCVLGGGSTGRGRPNLDCSPAPSSVCTFDIANRATGRDDLPVVGLPGHDDPDSPDGGDGSDGSCGNHARAQRVEQSLESTAGDADARAVTVLYDADGSDRYTVPWSHDDPLFGLIEDCYPGELDRVNTNRDFIQGGALSGLALAWDDGDGDDVFRGRLNVQGSGHVGGVGMLVVTGGGDTTMWADRLSQGNGIAAGIGIVANSSAGDQTYLLEAPQVYRNEFAPNARDCQAEGRAGQGEGGFGGIGILATSGGASSVYRAVAHVVENAYPYRAVLGSDGAPKLVAGTDAQGSGESFPITGTSGGIVAGGGLLLDGNGADPRTCATHPSAGMLTGSTTSTGIDLSTIGVVDRSCGSFNVAPELDPVADLATALQRLSAGAIGVRVVVPS